jgi:hypothetical protein
MMTLNWVKTEDEYHHVTKNGCKSVLCSSPKPFSPIPKGWPIQDDTNVCQICYVKSIHELVSENGLKIKKLEIIFENGKRHVGLDVALATE